MKINVVDNIICDSNKRRQNKKFYQKEFVLITIVIIEVVNLTPKQKCRHFSLETNYLKKEEKKHFSKTLPTKVHIRGLHSQPVLDMCQCLFCCKTKIMQS